MMKIENVSLENAKIDGQNIAWAELFRAAKQDYDSGTIGVPANGDHDLADAYREILRVCLPSVCAAEDAAYRDYCAHGLTTRGSDPIHAMGHGSWVSGPDGERQSTWYSWRTLREKISAAAKSPVTA